MTGGHSISNNRTERSVIRYLAALGILLAFGIDVALPAFDEITAELPGVGDDITLIGTTYFLGLAVGQLFFGPISDRFGRRNALLAGLVLYAIGALGATLAPNFETLLIARAIWGFGGASPAVLRVAIARDLYDGDRMARVITIVMAVFLIGPVLVPFIGEGILRIGSWRLVFGAAMLLSIGAATWTMSFGETLAEDNRRPLSARPLLEAFSAIIRNRQTIAHIGALTLYSGAFFIYLGSGQPIIDQIYGRGSQFAWWFGLGGVVMIGALLISDQLIARFGAPRVMTSVSMLMLIIAAIGLVLALIDGRSMSFGVWIVWMIAINAMQTLATPLANSLALEPMGAMAGTASAVLGSISLGGGALLASIVDQMIDESVFPMVVANMLAMVGGFILVRIGRPTPASSPERVHAK